MCICLGQIIVHFQSTPTAISLVAVGPSKRWENVLLSVHQSLFDSAEICAHNLIFFAQTFNTILELG